MDSKVLKRMERFEAVMAEVIDMTPDWIRNNRFESHEGYKLPRLAHDYRVYCATLESVVIELPFLFPHYRQAVIEAVEIAQVQVKS